MLGQTRIVSGSIPKYRQLLIILRNRILTGELAPGDRLPSEDELTKAYGLSRGTVRKAIAQLEAERLVETSHGVGSFVRPTYPNTIPFRFIDPRRFAPGTPGGVSYRTTAQEIVPAPMEIAERLHVPFGSNAIHIARLALIDDRVVSCSERFLLEGILPSLLPEKNETASPRPTDGPSWPHLSVVHRFSRTFTFETVAFASQRRCLPHGCCLLVSREGIEPPTR